MYSAAAKADKMLNPQLTVTALLAASLWGTSEGSSNDVACPGKNNVLQCPKGQVIQVLSIGHGSADDIDCSDRTTPRELKDDQCLNEEMQGWITFICNGLERCRLPKLHKAMFVCSDITNDFLQVSYNCVDRSPGERSVVTCEGNEAKLKCESGVITIKMAAYGRLDGNICTTKPSIMTFCRSMVSDTRVRKMCDNKAECTINVTDKLGKPPYCDSNPKYLTVDYTCD